MVTSREPEERVIVSLVRLETGRTPLSLTGDLDHLGLSEWLKPLSPLKLEGYVDRFGEMLTIRLEATADIEQVCGRCAVPFRGGLHAEVFVLADRLGADDEKMTRELEQEGHVVYHDGVQADITDAVREAIILSLDISPLCREDCRGLCSGCGADLNTEACRCTGTKAHPGWSALEKLREKKD